MLLIIVMFQVSMFVEPEQFLLKVKREFDIL